MKAVRVCQILICVVLCGGAVKAQWIKLESGTLSWLQTIYFIDRNNGFVGGSNGALLSTADGGKTWSHRVNITKDNIKEISFSDARHGWMLCERNFYASGQISPSYLFETSDAGQTWREANFPPGSERITHLFSAPAGTRYAIGESGAFYHRQTEPDGWKKRDLPVRFLLLDGEFFNDLRGLIVGGGGLVLYTENKGLDWNRAVLSDGGKTKLNAFFFSDQNNGWAVGEEGKIYGTKNGGKFWQLQNAPTTANLKDVFFASRRDGMAVGDRGTILRTSTGGETWEREATLFKHQLNRVSLVGDRWLAVGFGGTILTKTISESEKRTDKSEFSGAQSTNRE